MTFNPKDHMTKMGNREYLEVKWRICWFRDLHPLGRIETDVFTVGDMIAVKAIVADAEGRILASGLSTVRDASQREATWAGRIIEKAETSAIGRALGAAGFGTQFTGEDEEEGDYLSDSPVETPARTTPQVVKKSDETGEKYTAVITKVDVKLNKHNKHYIVAGGITFNSRDAFRELGYDDNTIEKLGKVGAVTLPDGIVISYVLDGNGYKKPVVVRRVGTGDIYEVAAA